jgi:hypothetical protein
MERRGLTGERTSMVRSAALEVVSGLFQWSLRPAGVTTALRRKQRR